MQLKNRKTHFGTLKKTKQTNMKHDRKELPVIILCGEKYVNNLYVDVTLKYMELSAFA